MTDSTERVGKEADGSELRGKRRSWFVAIWRVLHALFSTSSLKWWDQMIVIFLQPEALKNNHVLCPVLLVWAASSKRASSQSSPEPRLLQCTIHCVTFSTASSCLCLLLPLPCMLNANLSAVVSRMYLHWLSFIQFRLSFMQFGQEAGTVCKRSRVPHSFLFWSHERVSWNRHLP